MFRCLAVGGLLLALLLASCADDEEEARIATPPFGEEIQFSTLSQGDQTGVHLDEPQVFAIRDEAEWEEFWQRHAGIAVPPPGAPEVDLDQNMALAVVDQAQPSGGYSLEVRELIAREDTLEIRALRRVPGPTCVTTAVITYPHHIITLPHTDLPPDLTVTSEEYEC